MLDIKVAGKDGKYTISVWGELDIAYAERFDKMFLDLFGKGCELIEIDLAGLEFVDSTGVRSLMGVLKSAIQKQIEITITNVQPMVYDVLETTGLVQLFGRDMIIKV